MTNTNEANNISEEKPIETTKTIEELTSDLVNSEEIVAEPEDIKPVNSELDNNNDIANDDVKMEETKKFTPEKQNEIIDGLIKYYKDTILIMYIKETTSIATFILGLFTDDQTPVDVLYDHLGKEFILKEAVIRFLGINTDTYASSIGDSFNDYNNIISSEEAQKEIARVTELMNKQNKSKENVSEPPIPYIFEKGENGELITTGYTIDSAAKIKGIKLIIEDNRYINTGISLI